MEKNDAVSIELLVGKLWNAAKEDRCALLGGLSAGFLAFTYAFTNKLLNADELGSLFGKGETIASGRWGLIATEYLFPSVSLPWLYGALSVLLLAVAAAVLVRLCGLKSPLLQVLAGAVIVCFPAETGTLCYMFTSAPYALAFLLAALSVWVPGRCWPERQPRWGELALGAVLLLLSLSIYQSYLSLASSMFLLLIIRALLEDRRSPGEVFSFSLRCLLLLAAAVTLYLATSSLCIRVYGGSVNEYAFSEYGFPHRLRLAYTTFAGIFLRGYFGYVSTQLSQVMHWLCLALTGVGFLCWFLRVRSPAKAGLMLLSLLLLPLSVCCIYLVSSPSVVHTLVLYGFVSFYLLAAMTAERVPALWGALSRNLLPVALAIVVACNIYLANKTFFMMYLEYENAYSYYSGVLSQVFSTEGFDRDTKVAICGWTDNYPLFYIPPELETFQLGGPSGSLINSYTRDNLIRIFLGFDLPAPSAEELEAIQADPRYQEMPVFPYHGSVANLDGTIVVKLG